MGLLSRLLKKKKRSQSPKVEKRTLLNMKVGDMVTYDLEDYEVVGKLILNDHGFQWFEYQLETPGEKAMWLSVEQDDELELAVYKKIHHPIQKPIPDQVEVNGIQYKLEEKGMANVSGQGRSTHLSGQTVEYYDFIDDSEEHLLSIEAWRGDIEVSKGRAAEEFEFEIIAGSH